MFFSVLSPQFAIDHLDDVRRRTLLSENLYRYTECMTTSLRELSMKVS